MKKLITIILFLFTLTIQSQSIAIYQDLRLATMQDDYGNEPFTLDITIKYEEEYKTLLIGFSYEFSQLQTNYHRITLIGGHIFKINKRINITFAFDQGIIIHNKKIYVGTIGIINSVDLPMTKILYLSLLNTYIYRTDYTPFWRYNFSIGIKYKFK